MAKKKVNPFEGHAQPVTRRDFLSRGAIGFSAAIFAPSVLRTLRTHATLLQSRKMRGWDTCGPPAGSAGLIPMLVFDCAGGAAFAGNFLVGGPGGPQDLLPSYDTLGWDPRAAGAIDSRFGLPMAANASQILAGILAASSAQAQANFRMGSFCHLSQDDSQINNTSALILALENGAYGSIVNRGIAGAINPANLLFPLQTLTGGNSSAVDQSPAYQPVIANSIDDVLGAVSFGPALGALSDSGRRALIQSALSMSVDQLNALTQGSPGDFSKQMGCAYQAALGYTASGPALDPRNDTSISQIYGLSSTTASTDPNLIAAAVVMNVLKGQTGPGVITIGGCDYHDGTQTTGDGIDLTIGTQIGRALEAAHLLKTPVFFQILTDGGLSAMQGTRNWAGDSGIKGMTIIGYYNPTSAPTLINPLNPQIGAFNSGQGADTGTLVGSDTGKVCYGVYANYLQVCGKLGANADLFNSVFGTGAVDQVLVFSGS